MQKVVGPSPIIRFDESPTQAGFSVFKATDTRRVSPVSAFEDLEQRPSGLALEHLGASSSAVARFVARSVRRSTFGGAEAVSSRACHWSLPGVGFYALAATRRKATSLMLTPGAAQLLAGGADRRACSSVSNTTNEKPWPSTGSSQ
jgi:hypothetical protein